MDTVEIKPVLATDESLQGYGYLVRDPKDYTTAKKTFEIVPWPVQGWRQLDPDTGDEAGTTEGCFTVRWQGDFYYSKNFAVATSNNSYLDGIAAMPEIATHEDRERTTAEETIHLWMSDYHPDGGQLFWPMGKTQQQEEEEEEEEGGGIPFTVCLGLPSCGDDVTPGDMKAFYVPAGYGLYIHPGTWHNGIYVSRQHAPASFLTRQGRVHGRISASWAREFKCLLKISLAPPS